MNKRSLRITTSSLLAAAVFTTVFSGQLLAESACKGLDQRQCEGKSDCTWVDGYTRKDGVKVSSHCKAIGKRDGSSSSKESAREEKASASKDSSKEKKSTTKEKKSSKKDE